MTSRLCRRALIVFALLAATLGGAFPALADGGPSGYWLVGADGRVYPFGGAADLGSLSGSHLNQPVVCLASTATGAGYWLVARDGGVFAFGDATFAGSTSAVTLNQPIVGMAAAQSGPGYWLVASDGGIFAFGDAGFYGSTGSLRLNQPVVGMAATPSAGGYWLVARDGGTFAFGDAGFFGSTGAVKLNKPIVGMAATPSGQGYWLVASDGGVFAFGDAAFFGSAAGGAGDRAANPVVAMAATPSGAGYWLTARDGGVYTYGDAAFAGSAAGLTSDAVVGISPVGTPGGCGGFEQEEDTPADRLAEAARYAAGRAGTAGVAMIDTTNGRVLGNADSTAPLRTASIVKVMVGMRLFARAEEQHRPLTADEQQGLASMIRVSDNDATTRLWRSLGGPAVIGWIRQVTGVRATQPPGDGTSWGFTVTTAHDMAVILSNLAHAHGLTHAHRDALLREMRQVIPSQRWGISPAVHHSNPAVKNGWYPDTDAPVWRVHCTGVVDDGPKPNRWVIVVTTRYPANLGQEYGEETCSEIAARALPPTI